MSMLDMQIDRRSSTMADRLFVIFCRLMAVLALSAGLGYWMRVTGLASNPAERFDLFSPEWRALAASLAVLFPVAALGLWLATRWGLVVWVIAVFIEVLAYGFWSGIFGSRSGLLLGHIVIMTIMLVLVTWLGYEKRTERLTRH